MKGDDYLNPPGIEDDGSLSPEEKEDLREERIEAVLDSWKEEKGIRKETV